MTTQPSSLPVGQVPAQVVQRHPKRQTALVAQKPLFGFVSVSGGDQVHFGRHGQKDGSSASGESHLDGRPPSSTDESLATEEIRSPSRTRASTHKKPSTPKPPKAEYGYFQNNVRAGLGVILSDLVPIALSLPMLTGAPGFLLALACIPASYISGKLGRWISRDVKQENLNPVFKYFSDVRSVFSDVSSEDVQTKSPVTRLNEAANELFNIRGAGPVAAGFINGAKKWLQPKITLSKDSGIGKYIQRFVEQKSLLRAEVNIRVSQADGLGQATVAAGKGVMDYTFYSILNRVGTALCSWNFGPAKWAGEMMKHAGLVKIGFDVLKGTGNNQAHT